MSMYAKKLGIALVALFPLVAAAQNGAQDPVAEYENLLREIRGLQAYNALIQRQISAQEVELADIRVAVDQVPDLQRQLPPLLIRMVDGLQEFVNRDLPFLTDERNDRIANLYSLIENPQVNDATKLRRILEAWSIEVEYGAAYQTFQGKVPIANDDRDADFVSIGRVGLIFQTSDDDATTGAWDASNNSWIVLGSEHRNSVRQAIRMARNQIAPELVLLPVPPPQPK